MAITQPGGAGTTIRVYDDAASGSGTGYTFTEIAAAFPADFVDNGTNRRSYRAKVSVQIGDTTVGTATTTVQDTNATVIFDSTKTITRSGNANTYLRLGTKVGSGDEASGINGCDITLGAAPSLPLNSYLYGCTMRQTSGAFLNSGNDVAEFVNCIFHSSASGTAPLSFGTFGGGAGLDNLYNVDISHVTTAQVMSNFYAATASRLTVACPAPTTFLSTSGINITVKDLAMFGSPTQSDLRWASPLSATDWVFVRPRWTGNAPKFSAGNSTSSQAGKETREYWIYNAKCVGPDGSGIEGIPVTLTDILGNVQVNTTTDANGEIAFGADITQNAVCVMDHYAVSGVYTQRHRGPFTARFNYGAGANPIYQPRTVTFKWTGHNSITTSSGSFADVNDIVLMEPVDSIYISSVPIEGHGVERVQLPIPATT